MSDSDTTPPIPYPILQQLQYRTVSQNGCRVSRPMPIYPQTRNHIFSSRCKYMYIIHIKFYVHMLYMFWYTWSVYSHSHLLMWLQRFQSTTFLFLSAEANSCPLGCQAHVTISLLCSFLLLTLPVSVSHTNRVPSEDPAATYWPSGLKLARVQSTLTWKLLALNRKKSDHNNKHIFVVGLKRVWG